MVVFVWCARRDGGKSFVGRAYVQAWLAHSLGHEAFAFSPHSLYRLCGDPFLNRVQASYPTDQKEKPQPFGCGFLFGARGGT